MWKTCSGARQKNPTFVSASASKLNAAFGLFGKSGFIMKSDFQNGSIYNPRPFTSRSIALVLADRAISICAGFATLRSAGAGIWML